MAKQNQSAQANNKTQIQLKAADKATLTIPTSQHLEQATKSADGAITIKQSMGALKLVDVADVDLLLTFANGEHVVIPHGAIDAVGKNPPDALFSDSKISLPELFKLVGVTNPAKAGSLRLVSENIDANPPTDENVSHDEHIPDTPPPPAPMLKVGAGQGAGKSLGTGLGSVPETYTPLVTAQPSVYRVGKSSTSSSQGESFGSPKVTAALYTSSELKTNYAGMSHDLPQGAFSATADATELATRQSPASQSFVETITGTAGDDNIDHNTIFTSGPTQWGKTIHIGIDNFTSVSAITIVFTSNVLGVPGFGLVGVDGAVVTQDTADPKIWHITPTTAMLKDGVNIGVVYDVQNISTSTLDSSYINFVGDIIVDGKVGAFNFQVINNLNMTWRDAVTQADFNKVNENGTQLMVLPKRGVGTIIEAGDGNDTINAGAGNDLIIGGLGADAIDGGYGNDTVSYKHAAQSIIAKLTSNLSVIELNSGDLAAGDTFVANTIENLVGSGYNDILIGDTNKNILDGGGSNDILIGMGGGDTFIGGANDAIDNTYNQTNNLQGDTVSYQYATSGATASLSQGKGLSGSANGDVYIGIENLTGSKFADILEGDSYANVINGGINSSSFNGTINDTGLTDTVSYERSSAAVTVNLGLNGPQVSTGDANGDILLNIQNIKGSAYNDTFIGDNNALGNAFDGGGGINTVSYATSTSGVTASLNGGSSMVIRGVTYGTLTAANTGDATKDTYTNIQILIGSNGNDILTGSYRTGDLVKDSNTIDGGAGNDTIYTGLDGNTKIMGGSGDDIVYVTQYVDNKADVLDGGAGNDTFVFAATPTVYSLDMGQDGIGSFTPNNIRDYANPSTPLTAGTSYVTLMNFENITILNTNYNGLIIASNFNNIIKANSNIDTNTIDYRYAGLSQINGAGVTLTLSESGTTSVSGGSGNDTISNFDHVNGSTFADTITGNSHANKLSGGEGNDTLTGGGGNDTLTGGNGIDILNGGTGDDIMEGGDGADAFNGGDGTDTVTYANSGPVTVNINSATSETGFAAGDTFSFVEKFIGSSSDDTFMMDVSSTLPIDINGSGNTAIANGGGDTIKLNGLVGTYSLSTISAISTSNEVLKINGDGANTAVTLSAADIINFVDATNPTLKIIHDVGDGTTINPGDYLVLSGGSTFDSATGSTTLLGNATTGIHSVYNGGSIIAYINWATG